MSRKLELWYVMTLMVQAVWIMLRTVLGPWCHDAPVKFWELWKCEFWKLCFHLCKYLSRKVRIMFPDYTGKLFLAGCEKCSGESCHLLFVVWSSPGDKPLYVFWKQQLTNRNAEYAFRGNTMCFGPATEVYPRKFPTFYIPWNQNV